MIGRISDSMALVKKALDVAALRNKTIADNIANEDTPGYKRKRVDFESYFSELVNRPNTTSSEIAARARGFNPSVIVEDSFSLRKDGNNVNIDVETTELAANSIKYNALSQQIQNQFTMLKLVARDTK